MPSKTLKCKRDGISRCRKCSNKSKKCIKKCMSYSITYKGGSNSQKVCPRGKILNPTTNRCNKKVCPRGKILNPTTNRCNKKVCPRGKILNPTTNRCNKTKSTSAKPLSIRKTPSEPPKSPPKQIDPNYIGKKNEVDYLADKLRYNEFRENTLIPIDNIISRLSPAEKIKWEDMNLQESDIVWEDVDEDVMYCGRAVFLVQKKRNKLFLMIFPSCCQNMSKLKDENGKVNHGEDKHSRYDFTEGDCIDNGYMIHPKSYKIIKVF